MNRLVKSLVICLMFGSTALSAEIAIIVNPNNNNAIDNSHITRIFLGKSKSFPDGSKAVPVNLNEGNASGAEFNKKVLNKSASQLKAYWSKLVFTGKGTPPKNIGSDSDMIKYVQANPNAIGYVSASNVDSSVKVVTTL